MPDPGNGSTQVTEPKPVVDKARQLRMHAAELMTASSYVAGLVRCKARDDYTSLYAEDSYYRLRGIMVTGRESGIQDLEMASSIGYSIYQRTLYGGTLYKITVPTENNPENKFQIDEILNITGRAECETIEKQILKWRERGNLLDVKPYHPEGSSL